MPTNSEAGHPATSKNTPTKSVSKHNNSMLVGVDDGFNPVKGEMALWAAVITQALMDAGSESKKMEAQHEKAKAIRWLLGNSDDFILVCLHAGLDPDYVREKAKAAIANGCNWRQGLDKQRAERRETRLQAAKTTPSHRIMKPEYERKSNHLLAYGLSRKIIPFSSKPDIYPAIRTATGQQSEWRIAG